MRATSCFFSSLFLTIIYELFFYKKLYEIFSDSQFHRRDTTDTFDPAALHLIFHICDVDGVARCDALAVVGDGTVSFSRRCQDFSLSPHFFHVHKLLPYDKKWGFT